MFLCVDQVRNKRDPRLISWEYLDSNYNDMYGILKYLRTYIVNLGQKGYAVEVSVKSTVGTD